MYFCMRAVCLPPTSIIVAFVLVLSGCDASDNTRTCEALAVNNYSNSANLAIGVLPAAQFFVEQTVTTYETGDCEAPSSDTDGVRVLIMNLTTCRLDIDFSLSVFEGSVGWTVTGSSTVENGRTIDTGIVIRKNAPLVDQSQIVLTGTAVSSNCV
jgi:hypothetical protein